MIRYFILFLCFHFLFNSAAQSTGYRSAENPFYWKNKKPYEGYWQQDVQYKIKATIDDSTDIVDGHFYELTYWNNSPHTLTELYFHLYQNAFQPESHMHDLYKNNDQEVKFGRYEQQKKGTEVFDIQVNGESVDTTLDNTILRLNLNKPLLPNDSVVVTMRFKTYFDTGSLRRRMKTFDSYGEKHYDGVHWYPIITVYDRKFAWTTEQHLDKEFYADFGSFDVELTFPNHFIVDATGVLQNKEEVLPDSLRKKLDLSNFKLPVTTPSVIVPREKGKTKTWKFYAENVHNFAFTADPTYRIGELTWKGIKVVTLAREPNASKWQESGEFTKKVIKTYSEDFGMYAWPKIIVADANDGMEYPMLTLDNGSYPGHQSLLAHEVGHMWFYGMVGTNETYRAMMDEGFTQFLTIWSMDKITGTSKNRTSKNKFVQKRLRPYRNRYERLYFPYIRTVHDGFDKNLNTHSSDFNGAIRHGGNYGLVYYKTGVMLYNLRYVLGDSLFQGAMKHYFHQWKMAHPYPEDFRNSITAYTQTDLNWFFDQWMETTKTIDYSIDHIEQQDANNYQLTFSRKGEMQMPLDFEVITETDTLAYHIPNTWFIKNTDATVLPKWYGWGNINKTHTVTISSSSPILDVVIDPEHYLADVNLTNNQYQKNVIEFDHRVKNYPDWSRSHHYIRPDVWYNHFDGVQAGVHVEGNYFHDLYQYDFTLWGNTRAGQFEIDENVKNNNSPISFEFSASEKLTNIWTNLYFKQHISYNVGLFKSGLGLEKRFQKRDTWNANYTTAFIGMDFLYRPYRNQYEYLLYENSWGFERNNNTIGIGLKRNYEKKTIEGNTTIRLKTPGLFADYNYSNLDIESKNKLHGKYITLNSRFYGRLGFGNNLPTESLLYLAGASPLDMNDNKYTRASGFVPVNLTDYSANNTNHFQHGGGLNLRGYAGYLIIENGHFMYASKSGVSASFELDFQDLIYPTTKKKLRNFSLRTYLFSDLGSIEYNNRLSNVIADAGLGSVLTIKFPSFNITPIELRFDMPLYLNAPPSGEESFKLRYLVGVSSSF